MNRTHDATKSYRALEDYWPPVMPRSTVSTKARCAWPPMPAPPTSSNRVSRPRRSVYSHLNQRQDQHYTDTSIAFDFRTHHLQRQFSEDSGFSSCGSSASSVADDLETFSGPVRYGPPSSNFSRSSCSLSNSSSRNCRLQSGTVASVLAAGVSDSEETDCESDYEGSDGVFSHLAVSGKNKVEDSRFLLAENQVYSLTHFLPNDCDQKDPLQLKHCGRNILDLGSNLMTKFPLQATELPEKNLPLFLQNRSQYHRLGKFGAVERLSFATCAKQCGFAFPIPPKHTCEKKM